MVAHRCVRNLAQRAHAVEPQRIVAVFAHDANQLGNRRLPAQDADAADRGTGGSPSQNRKSAPSAW